MAIRIEENVSLKMFNTFGIDVSASHFSVFSTIEDIQEILDSQVYSDNNPLIFGGGSNVLLTKNV